MTLNRFGMKPFPQTTKTNYEGEKTYNYKTDQKPYELLWNYDWLESLTNITDVMVLVSAYLYCTIYLNRTTMRQIQVKHNDMIPGEQNIA